MRGNGASDTKRTCVCLEVAELGGSLKGYDSVKETERNKLRLD